MLAANKIGCCSFSLDITRSAVSMHPQTSLKYLNLIELFIPYNFSSCPALVHKPAVPLKTIHNHKQSNIRVSFSNFVLIWRTVCWVKEGISGTGYDSVLKGDWLHWRKRSGSSSRRSINSILPHGLVKLGCAELVLAKKKTKKNKEKQQRYNTVALATLTGWK